MSRLAGPQVPGTPAHFSLLVMSYSDSSKVAIEPFYFFENVALQIIVLLKDDNHSSLG